MITVDPVQVQLLEGRGRGIWQRRLWEVIRPIKVSYHGYHVMIKQGTRTDFASVPRPLQWLLNERSIYSVGALAHDRLYFEGLFSRAVCDAVFLELLAHGNVSRFDRWVMYLAVRLFGRGAWERHRRLGHPQRNTQVF